MSAASRQSHADEQHAASQPKLQHILECSKLAAVLHPIDTRPIDERAQAVMQMLQQDEKCKQPLLDLSYQLAVSLISPGHHSASADSHI